jgi:tetratricopeptide (TPR) repeat protein
MSLVQQVRIAALSLGAVALLACGSRRESGEPFPAQSPWVAPERPVLPAGADTNNASAYFLFGELAIYAKPDTAAAAFYWATRLDPWRAKAYYARAIALVRSLMAPHPGTSIWVPKRRLRETEMQVIDSLYRVAYNLNPFIDRRLDYLIGPPVQFLICGRVRDPISAGICFLHKREYAEAVRSLGAALKKKPKEIDLHYLRAQAFFRLLQFDSAATELRLLADSLESRQTKKAMMYVSRAAIFYAQGMAYTEHGDTTKARDAYERALVEDLSFHMASVRLAGHALTTGDTAAALNHLAHAVGVRPADVPLRLYYGIALSNKNQRREAAEQYMRAIEINPYYAPPYLHLGRLLEQSDLENAVTSYHMYLGLASQSDSTRNWVVQRLHRLESPP